MLSEYLKSLRRHAQLTSNEWAVRSGVSHSTLWRWENGKTLPRDEELKLALAALETSPAERLRAIDLLYQERAEKGIGSILSLRGTALKRNELLRALRLRSGLSQNEAAERIGVNRVTVASWERGAYWPEAAKLHQVCQIYGASSAELVALTVLDVPSKESMPSQPDLVMWDDIETYEGDFRDLDLRYLTHRAQLAQMPQTAAREREVACTLDYLHLLIIKPRRDELRRELRRLATQPVLLASPALFARHQVLSALAQGRHSRGNRAAERLLGRLLSLEDAVPVSERFRAKVEWSERLAEEGELESALRLSEAASVDAKDSGSPHLLALDQRQRTAMLINVGKFDTAAKALDQFPNHTPLLEVQQHLTHAMLLEAACSWSEAISAYEKTAQAAEVAGILGYVSRANRAVASLSGN